VIKVGCTSYPIAQKTYQAQLPVIELDALFESTPLEKTLVRWREEAPKDFEFVVAASHHITHPSKPGHLMARHSGADFRHRRVGYFQDTPEVKNTFARTLKIADVLRSKLILFTVPHSFAPHADNIGRIQKFFQKAPQDQLQMVWEAPPTWPQHLVEQLCKTLRLIPALNPFKAKPAFPAAIRYYRVGDLKRTRGIHSFTPNELKDLKRMCDMNLCYVIFNNGPTAFKDATHFSRLVKYG